jgi:hypothetical protein
LLARTQNKIDDKTGVYLLTKALKLVLLSVLTKHTGANYNQPVEPAKDWRSECLDKQNLHVVELCGVLGRLHSSQGLAQSNNNAKLNNSATHDQTLMETNVKKVENKEQNVERGGVFRWEEKNACPGRTVSKRGSACEGHGAWGKTPR